jgi:hypothetical protein
MHPVQSFGTSGSRGPIWSDAEINLQMAGLRAGLSSAGIRIVEVGRHLREPIGTLFAQSGTAAPYGSRLGKFDTDDDEILVQVPLPLSSDHAIIQANWRASQQFNADDGDDVIDIFFTPPFLEGFYGLAFTPSWIAAVNTGLHPRNLPITMANQLFVSLRAAKTNTPMVLAHEVLHHLTNKGDLPNLPVHILFPRSGSDTNYGSTPVNQRRIQESTALEARVIRPAANLSAVGNRLLRNP